MKKNKKDEKGRRTNLDVLPIRAYDAQADAFVLKDGSFLDIWEKTADDVGNMLEDEVQLLMIRFAKFLKLYKEDLKIVSMDFPTDTVAQQKLLARKRGQRHDPVREKWITRSITELQRAAGGTRKREYYFFVTAKNLETLEKNRQVFSVMAGGIRPVPEKKKVQILYKLNNMDAVMARKEEL